MFLTIFRYCVTTFFVLTKENDKYEGCSADVKALLRYRSKTMKDLRGFWTKKCDRCKEIKPARAHHCAVCDVCVF